jgi:hypothetical protein
MFRPAVPREPSSPRGRRFAREVKPLHGPRPTRTVRSMKHVLMADRSLLLGDEAADLLLDYAVLVAQLGRGDGVRLNAIGADGEHVAVAVLLNSGSSMLLESSVSTLPEPDNAGAIAYLRGRLAEYDSAVQFQAAARSSKTTEAM